MSETEQIEELKKAHEQFMDAVFERLENARKKATDLSKSYAVDIAARLYSQDEKEINKRKFSHISFTKCQTQAETFEEAITEIRTEIIKWQRRNWRLK